METQTNEQATQDLGGLKIPATESAGTSAPASVGVAAQNVIKARRGRPPGSSNNASKQPAGASVPLLSLEQFRTLYSSELWARIATSPGDTALALTGNKIWEISAEEKKTLGDTCSIAAQCFATADPRWLAATAALVTISEVYGTRLAIYIAEKKREKEKADKEKKA